MIKFWMKLIIITILNNKMICYIMYIFTQNIFSNLADRVVESCTPTCENPLWNEHFILFIILSQSFHS